MTLQPKFYFSAIGRQRMLDQISSLAIERECIGHTKARLKQIDGDLALLREIRDWPRRPNQKRGAHWRARPK